MLLREQVSVNPEFAILDRLGKRAAENPRNALEIVRLLVATDQGRWRILGIRENLRELLKDAMAADDAQTREAAEQIINTLGAKGMADYRDLLAR